jgi:hypothetical protein
VLFADVVVEVVLTFVVVLVPVVLVDVLEVVVPVTAVEVVDFVPVVELDAEVVAPLVSMYISNRFPAPQYSYGLPGQTKEQSVKAARTDPVLMTLPQ